MSDSDRHCGGIPGCQQGRVRAGRLRPRGARSPSVRRSRPAARPWPQNSFQPVGDWVRGRARLSSDRSDPRVVIVGKRLEPTNPLPGGRRWVIPHVRTPPAEPLPVAALGPCRVLRAQIELEEPARRVGSLIRGKCRVGSGRRPPVAGTHRSALDAAARRPTSMAGLTPGRPAPTQDVDAESCRTVHCGGLPRAATSRRLTRSQRQCGRRCACRPSRSSSATGRPR